jgi:hypothetical protein
MTIFLVEKSSEYLSSISMELPDSKLDLVCPFWWWPVWLVGGSKVKIPNTFLRKT